MTIVTVRTFDGMSPKRASRRQAEPSAQVAEWTRLDNKQLRAWHEPVRIAGQCPPFEFIYGPGPGGGGGGGGSGSEQPHASGGVILSGTAGSVLALPKPPYAPPIKVLENVLVFSCIYDAIQGDVLVGEDEIWYTADTVDKELMILRISTDTLTLIDTIVVPEVKSNSIWGDFYAFDLGDSIVVFGEQQHAVIDKAAPYDYTYGSLSGDNSYGSGVAQVGTNYVWVVKYFEDPPYPVSLLRFNKTTAVFDGTSISVVKGNPDYPDVVPGSIAVLSSDTFLWTAQSGFKPYITKQAAGVVTHLDIRPVVSAAGINNPYGTTPPNNWPWVSSVAQIYDGRVYAFGPNWVAKLNPTTMTLSNIIQVPAMGQEPHLPVVDELRRNMWWAGFHDQSTDQTTWKHRVIGYDLDTETIFYNEPMPAGMSDSRTHIFTYRGGIDAQGNVYLTFFGGGASGGEFWHVVQVPVQTE